MAILHRITGSAVRRAAAVTVALVFGLATVGPALAGEALIRISTDPYTNPDSQHKTEVEPDTFAFGSTVVSAFQVGRFFDGGASNIGWATSLDQGKTWKHGFLPATTVNASPAGPYARASDASVAYDARDNVWLISYLGITANPNIVDVLVSRSTDGGLHWQAPVVVASQSQFFDKNWTVCDDSPTSPYYGYCYTEFDDFNLNDLILMSRSIDGGQTWETPRTTGDPVNINTVPGGGPGGHGLGGQPVVQPDGRVIVPIINFDSPVFVYIIASFVSVDGGDSWTASQTVSEADFHVPAGNLRADIPLPSAEVDKSGKVYVTWDDCRFEPQCKNGDLVFSTSSNGIQWSAVRRIPLDPVGSGVDHFLPGLAVDRDSTGKLALLYYFYPNGNCTVASCDLDVGFTSSTNGGASWSAHETLAGPMKLDWLPNTTQGRMVGDYFSTSIVPGTTVAVPVFMVAKAPKGSVFDQAAYTVPEDVIGGTLRGAQVQTAAEPAVASTRSATPMSRKVLPTAQ